MDRIEGATKVRSCLARDAAARDLFIPWYPLSRTAYVLPDPAQRETLARRMQLVVVFWLGVAVGMGLAGLFGELSLWPSVPFVVVALAHWAWWTWRQTRGLERTRYEPPSA